MSPINKRLSAIFIAGMVSIMGGCKSTPTEAIAPPEPTPPPAQSGLVRHADYKVADGPAGKVNNARNDINASPVDRPRATPAGANRATDIRNEINPGPTEPMPPTPTNTKRATEIRSEINPGPVEPMPPTPKVDTSALTLEPTIPPPTKANSVSGQVAPTVAGIPTTRPAKAKDDVVSEVEGVSIEGLGLTEQRRPEQVKSEIEFPATRPAAKPKNNFDLEAK